MKLYSVLFLFSSLICLAFLSPLERGNNGGDDAHSEHEPGTIVKSEKDTREYRLVTLQNGMECILVYDNLTESAAVQVRVAAGYVAEDIAGLAHFVEHMLFEGSEKYPDPQSYIRYIRDKGGYVNGATWETSTAYMFSLPNEGLEEASKMLSDIIANPLFSQDRLDTAIQAVNSEYKLQINNDYTSLYAVAFKNANPKSRYKQFYTGSIETLNVTGIREKVVQFHDRFYSGNLLKLAIVANMSLDRIQERVEGTFGNIPNKNAKMLLNDVPPFGPQGDKRYINRLTYVKKKSGEHSLNIAFPIMIENYPYITYIRYLLKHEGDGSLYQYLLRSGHITSLFVFNSVLDPHFMLLTIYIDLTEKGVSDPFFIVEVLFKYIKQVKVDSDIWNQRKKIAEFKFRFEDRIEPIWLTDNLLDKMDMSSDPREYLGSISHQKFDLDLENRILSFVNPENFNMYLGSVTFSARETTSYAPQLTKLEKYYNTSYEDVLISELQIMKLKNVAEDPDLHLPEQNIFVPENFDIVDTNEESSKIPVEISSENSDVNLWWYQESDFKQPKVTIECRLRPKNIFDGDKGMALRHLLHELFQISKKLPFYAANEVFFFPNFVAKNKKEWHFYIHGFSDPEKVENVLIRLMDVFFSLDFNQDEAHFNGTVRNPVMNSFDDENLDLGKFTHRQILLLLEFGHENFTNAKEIAASLSQKDIEVYRDQFLQNISITCSAIGNVKKEQAVKYVNVISEKISQHPNVTISSENRAHKTKVAMRKLPKGLTHVIRRKTLNSLEINSAAIVMFIIGPADTIGTALEGHEYTAAVITHLLDTILSSDCFAYLRTEKQLGYVANCNKKRIENITTFVFKVQGSRLDAGPDVFANEIDIFVNKKYAEMMTKSTQFKERLIQAKQAIYDELTKKPTGVFEKWSAFEQIIFDPYDQDFYKKDKMLRVLEEVTIEDVVQFFETHFIGDEKRKISSQVYGVNHDIPTSVNAEKGEILIEDIESYTNTLNEYWND